MRSASRETAVHHHPSDASKCQGTLAAAGLEREMEPLGDIDFRAEKHKVIGQRNSRISQQRCNGDIDPFLAKCSSADTRQFRDL
jgi:hypothetical protein